MQRDLFAFHKLATIHLLTGRTGAGKTTLSEKLAPQYDSVVQTDMPRPKNDKTGKYDEPTPEQKEEIRAQRLADILKLHGEGKRVLVEGHPPGIVKLMKDQLPQAEKILFIPMSEEESFQRVIKRAKEDPDERVVDIDVESARIANDKFDKYLKRLMAHGIPVEEVGKEKAASATQEPVLSGGRNTKFKDIERNIQQRANRKDPALEIKGLEKESLGTVSGFSVYRVDSEWIRNNLDPIFGCGGHGYVHSYIPMDEIWVDDKGRKETWGQIAIHEIAEHLKMKNGVPFHQAHRHALKMEEAIKTAAQVAAPAHQQEKLDTHFSSHENTRWRDFRRNLRSRGFVKAVQQDERADEKLKRFAEMIGRHHASKDPGVPVKGSSGKTYKVKYHQDLERFSCNCNHWVYDLSHQTSADADCKHIKQVRASMTKQAFQDLKPLLRGIRGLQTYSNSQTEGMKARISNDAYARHMLKRNV